MTQAVNPSTLSRRARRNRWLPRIGEPTFARVPAAGLDALVDRWQLEGPQTWEERKWRRIENGRPFSNSAPGRLQA